MIKIYSIRRLIIAYVIGWSIYVGTYFLVGRAEGGLFAIFVTPFIALYYTARLFIFPLLLGLFLGDDRINNLWYRHKWPFRIAIILGISCFVYGQHAWWHATCDLYNKSEAEYYQTYWINPSFILVLFSLCFRPTEPVDDLPTDDVQDTDEEIENENTELGLKRYTYKCDEGELTIEQKLEIPSSDDKAYLNGNPAPTAKYKIGEKQFVMVSNGNIYAVRGFSDKQT